MWLINLKIISYDNNGSSNSVWAGLQNEHNVYFFNCVRIQGAKQSSGSLSQYVQTKAL